MICPNITNKGTKAVFPGFSLVSKSRTPQCYYPNLTPGTYTFNDYAFVWDNETYTILVVTLYKTLLFRHDELKFNIGSGEVKDLGKFVIFFSDRDGNLQIDRIEKLNAKGSILQAREDLKLDGGAWKLK